jgi:hypothetical protein
MTLGTTMSWSEWVAFSCTTFRNIERLWRTIVIIAEGIKFQCNGLEVYIQCTGSMPALEGRVESI